MGKHEVIHEGLADKIVITGTIIETSEPSVNSIALEDGAVECFKLIKPEGTTQSTLELSERFEIPSQFTSGGIITQLHSTLQAVDGFSPNFLVQLPTHPDTHVWSILSPHLNKSGDEVLQYRTTSASSEELDSDMIEGYILSVPEVWAEITSRNGFNTCVSDQTLTLLIEHDELPAISEDQWGHTFDIGGFNIPEVMTKHVGDTFTLIIRLA